MWWRHWAPAIDLFRWVFEAAVINEIGDEDEDDAGYDGETALEFYSFTGVTKLRSLAYSTSYLALVWLLMLLMLVSQANRRNAL